MSVWGPKLCHTVENAIRGLIYTNPVMFTSDAQNTTYVSLSKVTRKTRETVPLSSIPPATRFNSRLSRNVYPALAHLSGG